MCPGVISRMLRQVAGTSAERLLPEQHGVLDRLPVVPATQPHDLESSGLIERSRRPIRVADLEQRGVRSGARSQGQRVAKQDPGDSPSPKTGTDSQIVDVNLVDHPDGSAVGQESPSWSPKQQDPA